MIDHERARELIATSIDFPLDDADRAELNAHLSGCVPCSAITEGLWADARAIADLPSVDAPTRLRARVLGVPDDTPGRPATHRSPFLRGWRLPAIATSGLAIAAVVTALVSGTLDWRATPSQGPIAIVSPSPGSSPGVEPSTPPAEGPETPSSASLVAESPDETVVGLRTQFRLTSLGDIPPEELAARLAVEPSVEFTVAPAGDGRSVVLSPNEDLLPGTVYRFTLRDAAGSTLDTWAFQTEQPVGVVSTVPRDRATGVPRNTTIEITFDQDGVIDAASHVSIAPATRGRFEQRGRNLVFIPARSLLAKRIYTVTVRKGIAVGGTSEVLERDMRFRFETAASRDVGLRGILQFGDILTDWPTATAPRLSLWTFDSEGKSPASVAIDVYRLSDRSAAIDAFRRLRSATLWAQFSTTGLVDVRGLPKVLSLTARVRVRDEMLSITLPKPLRAGWYVVEHPSKPRQIQTLLQVTDVAGYLAVTDTRTVVWANDLSNGGPIGDAVVSVGGEDIGRTDARGLLVVDTPQAVRGSEDAIVTLVARDGRSIFMPASGENWAEASSSYGGELDIGYVEPQGDSERYWHVVDVDRDQYRQTDTIQAWGTIRDRDSGAVPAAATLALSASGSTTSVAPIIRTPVTFGSGGTFTASLPYTDLPMGEYLLDLLVGTSIVDSQPVSVTEIRKPAYRLEVQTGHRVYIAGDRIRVTARASFYDGSPVPGVPLRINGEAVRQSTDAGGVTTYATTARVSSGEAETEYLVVTPARAEEGDIASAEWTYRVYPSSRLINVEAVTSGRRIEVTGSVHLLDRDRVERELGLGAYPGEVEERGPAIAGARVTAHMIRRSYYEVQVGTEYDEIEKKVVPIYETRVRERDAGTISITTRADGSYSTSFPMAAKDDSYLVDVRTTDRDGLTVRAETYAVDPSSTEYEELGLGLTMPAEDKQFGVGDPIDLTMREPASLTKRPGDRYLFLTMQRGLRDAVIQSSPRFRTTFPDWGPPNIDFAAVHFTGYRYEDGGTYAASFRIADRRLTVALTPDAARYRPGARVNVGVKTSDASGRPVAATVVLRTVDAKLFSIGAAHELDPLAELYAGVSSGLVASYVSHAQAGPPAPPGGDGYGDTGGGGEGEGRSDFRDVLTVQTVTTGPDGRGTASFELPDDLTSWVLSGNAFADRLLAGVGTVELPVGLPFFADATIAPTYLAADRPSIIVRVYGEAVQPDTLVTVSVQADEIGWSSGMIRGKASRDIKVTLPRFGAGKHQLTITARSGTGSAAKVDRLVRSLSVVESRLERSRTEYLDAVAGSTIPGGDGLTTIYIADAGAGRYLASLEGWAGMESARMERTLARAIAAGLLRDRYGVVASDAASPDFNAARFEAPDHGLALVPYGASDLEASVIAAIAAPGRFRGSALGTYFEAIRARPKETRERRIYALAGLAALGGPVLPEIRTAVAASGLTIRERLILGLGAAALGDAQSARTIASSFTSGTVEAIGDQARLRVGDDAEDVTKGTALLAMLTAALGDPIASRLWSYVANHPSDRYPYELPGVAVVGRLLERQAIGQVRFAYTLGGERHVVDLAAGHPLVLELTAAQRADLVVEPLGGQVGITATWREPLDASKIRPDPDVTIRRSVTPAGAIGRGDLVRVDIRVTFGPKAPSSCYHVTDWAPSGLVPVGRLEGRAGDDEPAPANVSFPYEQVGQRVSFCAEPTKKVRAVRLRYYARVVTPGTYAWGPAIVESITDADRASMTRRTMVTIR